MCTLKSGLRSALPSPRGSSAAGGDGRKPFVEGNQHDAEPAGVSGQQPDIRGLRESLDEGDDGIVGLIAQRGRIVADIARLKEHGTSAIRDEDRERRVLAGVEAVAAELGGSPSLVSTMFRGLIGGAGAN